MEYTVFALFENPTNAHDAVRSLKKDGYDEKISLIALDNEVNKQGDEMEGHEETTEGTKAGAVVGGIVGLLAGFTSLVLPGIGSLVVAGPLIATLGITGAAGGALTGGMVGAFIEFGIPEERAQEYETAIHKGHVLLAISDDEPISGDVQPLLAQHGADEASIEQVKTAGNKDL